MYQPNKAEGERIPLVPRELDARVPAEEVLAMKTTPADHATCPGRVILAKNTHGGSPYATWWQNALDGGCSSGHYFTNHKDAFSDFVKRCEHNF